MVSNFTADEVFVKNVQDTSGKVISISNNILTFPNAKSGVIGITIWRLTNNSTGEQGDGSSRVPTRATEEDWEIVGASEAAAPVTNQPNQSDGGGAIASGNSSSGGSLPPGV